MAISVNEALKRMPRKTISSVGAKSGGVSVHEAVKRLNTVYPTISTPNVPAEHSIPQNTNHPSIQAHLASIIPKVADTAAQTAKKGAGIAAALSTPSPAIALKTGSNPLATFTPAINGNQSPGEVVQSLHQQTMDTMHSMEKIAQETAKSPEYQAKLKYDSAVQAHKAADDAYKAWLVKSSSDEYLNAISRGEVSQAEQDAFNAQQKPLLEALEQASSNLKTAAAEYEPVAERMTFFQKGALENGVNLKNIAQGSLATLGDAGLNFLKGIGRLGEGLGDAITYGIADVGEFLGHKEWAGEVRERTSQDLVSMVTQDADAFLDKYSILGHSSDALAEGTGQVAAMIALEKLGAAAGLGKKGVSVLTSSATFGSGYGHGVSEAYQNNATDEQARIYGLICGVSDTVTELLFAGLGKGGKAIGISESGTGLDDLAAEKISSMFKKKLFQRIAYLGVKGAFEGLEELLSGGVQAWGKSRTWSEKDFSELVKDENLLEQFVIGMLTSDIVQMGGAIRTSHAKSQASNTYDAQDSSESLVGTGLPDGPQSISDKMSLRGGEADVAIPSDTHQTTPSPTQDTAAYLDSIVPKATQAENASATDSENQNEPGTKERIGAEDYRNSESPVWRNVEYNDETQKAAITQQTHGQMVSEGAIVKFSDTVTNSVEQAIPDLRAMRKKERTPILKEAINRLKNNLRKFLSEVSKQGFEFEVNGKILDARLYNTGINEVLEKVTKEKAGMLYSTEEIFRNARYLYSTPDYDGDPNVFRWNYFYTPVQIGEDIVGVRIAVRDMAEGQDHLPESQIYNWGIKKEDTPLDGAQPVVSDSSHGVSSGVSNDSIPQSNPVVNPSQDPAAYLASIVPKPPGGNTDQHVADYPDTIVPKAAANDKPNRKKGVVRGENVSIYDLMKTFNDVQGKAFQYLNTVTEITGIDIVLYRSEAGPDGKIQDAQGRYSRSEPGTIYIDLNAGLSDVKSVDDLAKYAMLRTFAHEFTHFVENWNPAQYTEFREVVFDTLVQRGENVQDLIEDKMARNPGMSPDAASREVVAEAMTDILPDSGFVQELAVKHQDLFHRLLKKLKAFVSNLRQYFDTIGHNPSREANALKEQVGDTVKYLDSIVQLFDQMAVHAVENYQQAVLTEKATLDNAGNDDVQYQSRNRRKYSYKNISQQEYRQIQEDRMEKYGNHFDEMPVIDYTHAHDQLYVFENFDETRFGVLEIFDPAKDKTKADIVVEAFGNGPVQNIQDLNGRITRLRNFQKLRSVYHSNARNGGTGTGNAGLGARSGGTSNRSGMPGEGNGNKVQHQQRTDTLTDREVLVRAVNQVAVTGLTSAEKDTLSDFQARLTELEKLQAQLWEQEENLRSHRAQNAPRMEVQKAENQIAVLKEEVQKRSQDLTKLERHPLLLQVRNKALPVIEAQLLAEQKARLEEYRKQYGTIPSGEQAVRPDALPRATNHENRVSYTARTVKGASVTSDDFADLIDAEVAEGGLTYLPITNNETTQKAVDHITKTGWEAARYRWSADIHAGKAGADMSAVGALLLNNAAKAGDKAAWLDILHDYQLLGTNTAQGLQALRILKTLNPSDKLYMAKRSVSLMVEDMHLDTEITIDPELEIAYINAKTDYARNAVLRRIQENVAAQIPSTFLDKFTALRYVNMLGNLRTQIRNIVGNLCMKAVRSVHNTIATSLEAIAGNVSGGNLHRTRSVTVSKAQKAAAKKDFSQLQSVGLGNGKYADSRTESTEFAQGIQDKRRIFGVQDGKWYSKAANTVLAPLEGYRKLTNLATDGGDQIFAKDAYARALAGYLNANGITETDYSKIDTSILNDARLFAVKEAQEATFRDSNWLSDWISKAGRRKDTPKVVKAVSEGVMPFRKTPANVLVRAEEYSPLGIINSVYYSVQAARKGSDVTGAQVINSWAKSLTGTGLFGLGMLLNSLGLLSAGPDDDEDQEGFESLNGWQNYAFTFPNGTNLTIDFLNPAAVPLLMGAELMKLSQDDGLSIKDLESALTSIADPLVEMSMLQGINDTLDNIKYTDNTLGQLLISTCLSYLSQGLTNTLSGQMERTFEDSRMTTYVDKDSPLPDWLQRTLGKASAKIPGWDYNQIPYINAWGEEEENPAWYVNGAYNLISPSYIEKGASSELISELNRLNDAQDGVNVYPAAPQKSITYGGISHNFSAEEYVSVAKIQGQTSRKIVESLISSPIYAALSDRDKANAIKYAYAYARETARIKVLSDYPGYSEAWMESIKNKPAAAIIDKVTVSSVTDALNNITAAWKNGDAADTAALDSAWGAFQSMDNTQRSALIKEQRGRVGAYLSARQAGISTDAFVDLYNTYWTLDNNKVSAAENAETWAVALDKAKESNTLTDTQREVMWEALGFYSNIRQDTEKYNALVDAGLSADKASSLTNWIDNIVPKAGSKYPSDAQKFEAILDFSGLTAKQEDAVLREYMDDNQERKYDAVLDMGLTAQHYVYAYNAIQLESGEGKKKRVIAQFQSDFGLSYTDAKALYEIYYPPAK